MAQPASRPSKQTQALAARAKAHARILGLTTQIRSRVRAKLRPSELTLMIGLLGAAVVGAAQLARVGEHDQRVGAACILAVTVALIALFVVVSRQRWKDPRKALIREVAREDRALAARVDRAIGLAVRPMEGEPPESVELAELHLSRQLEKIRLDRITERTTVRVRWVAAGALALSCATLGAIVYDPFRVVEGLDILFARNGTAPLRLVYLDEVDVVVTPPSYIGKHEEALANFNQTEQPRGSILTVRGRPEKKGRMLVLTDGNKEIPFMDDGHGGVVARWTLGDSTDLHVAARFGKVLVRQKDSLTVESIPDKAPEVELAGAPDTVKLASVPRISLAYEAKDDYGLTEIALVLRSGGTVESRTLSRPGGAKMDRGVHELSTQEPFFQNRYVPVEVTIEAKDNDAVQGPKWGVSAAFIVMPPLVGEPEALRFAALLRARDALVDLLAQRVTAGPAKSKDEPMPTLASDADAVARVSIEKTEQGKAMDVVEEVLAGTYGGISIRGRVRRVIAGQTRRLREALQAFQTEPTKKTFAELLETTEQVVLAIDAAIQRLGVEDARKVSKRLSDVAEEAAASCRAAREPDGQERGLHRLAAALEVVQGGGAQLAQLGGLGADLGDIARSGVGRIERERDAPNLVKAELAATDLARRLKDPVASIGGSGKPGVESGAGDSTGVGEDDASEADEQAEQNGKELDELIQRHQDEIDRVQKALEKATTPEEREALKKLAKEQAKAIREAVKDLPDQGLPGSAAEKGAAGKKRAEAMAGALEKGDVKDAIKEGKEAVDALREARKRGQTDDFLENAEVGKQATSAGNRIEEALEDLDKAMQQMQENAKGRAQKDLESSGQNEGRLAERARDLKKRGEEGDSSMPDDVLDRLQKAEEAMKEAKKALEEGDASKGQEKQKEAQRYLEMAHEDEDPHEAQRPKKERDGSDSSSFSQEAEVPNKDQHKGPEEFRKRVVDGLGRSSDARLKDAVQRYAEGLLK